MPQMLSRMRRAWWNGRILDQWMMAGAVFNPSSITWNAHDLDGVTKAVMDLYVQSIVFLKETGEQ